MKSRIHLSVKFHSTFKWDTLYVNALPEDDVVGSDVIVIGDLSSRLKNNKFVLNLFTKGSHHNHQNVILLTQTRYHKGSIVRDLNSHYLIIFKSPSDKMIIMILAKQTSVVKRKFLRKFLEKISRKFLEIFSRDNFSSKIEKFSFMSLRLKILIFI